MKIKAVGYVGLGAPDPEVWLQYATGIIGMMPARAVPGEGWSTPGTVQGDDGAGRPSGGRGIAEDGTLYLKMDERQWRVAVHPSEENRGLHYLGLEVDGVQELEAAVAELRQHGVAVDMGSADDAFGRGVTGLARFKDPAGVSLELFYGPAVDYKFCSPVPNTRFVAGHLGFGHAILFVDRMAEAFDFYTRVLGFQLTDFIRFGPGYSIRFLRCNERHHSIGLADVGVPRGLHHVMFEMQTADDVGRTLDRVQRAGIPVTASLGRHVNDHMLSFYMRSPYGFGVEIGCEGMMIDHTWTPNEFCEGDIWGHHGIAEDVQKSSE